MVYIYILHQKKKSANEYWILINDMHADVCNLLWNPSENKMDQLIHRRIDKSVIKQVK